ncbi:MAG: hypothetical protein KC656_00710 [Myxococcales bacterium]|nr:hypothetical protein [Myxococcales bacterium]
MPRKPIVLCVAALLAACKPPTPTEEPDPSYRFTRTEQLEDVVALASGTGGHLWLALGDDFALRESPEEAFTFVSRGDLPPGHVTFLGTIDGSREWLFAHVHGQGFFRNWAGSGTWDRVNGLQSPLLEVIRPGLKPIPTGMTTSTSDGVTWLSAIGGLYYTSDEGVTWDRADTSSAGDTNIVFTDVDAREGRVVSVAMLPSGLIPEQFTGLIDGRVYLSDNSGLTWSTPDEAFPSDHPTSVAVGDDGTIYVGTMDQGVVRGSGDGAWTPLFGPSDVIDVEWVDGGLSVASATRGLWRFDGELATAVGTGAAVGVAGGVGVLRSGEVFGLEEGLGDSPPSAENGTVYVALSFFGNFYHSTRGDTPTEDGFGQDIRVMTAVLDWLDERPDVRADWVFENARTTHERMPEHAPQLLERIRTRISSGRDDVRLMSSTAAPMASLTRVEFDQALDRAKDLTSLDVGTWVPGVQPADSMISPDHLSWYTQAGIEWTTLYYGANGFTGPRNVIPLEGAQAHNPYNLYDPATGGTLTAMPVYHHGDLLDHGGLRGWVKQLNANHPGDTLLVLHFDADAESWENFDRELDAIADLPFVRYTTLNDYLTTHDPGATHPLPGDVANGVGDGFSSWSEKVLNHRVWTAIEQSRQLTEAAELVAPADGAVGAAVRTALDARLDALAVNNFGLTQPNLHPQRVTAAEAYAAEALEQARIAYGAAIDTQAPLGAQQLEVLHSGVGGGAAVTVPFNLRMPPGSWEGEAGLVIERGNTLLPIRAQFLGDLGGYDVVRVDATVVLAPESRTILDWAYDPGEIRHARGQLTPADIPSQFLLQAPFMECASGRVVGTGGTIATTIGEWGLENARIEEWQLPSCQAQATRSTIRRVIRKRDELPGAIVEVTGTIDQAADAGGLMSIVLAPVTCPSGIEAITWRSYGDTVRTVAVPDLVEAWNPVSANGWVSATCGDGSTVQIAIDQTVSSSMGMLSLRNQDGEGLLAPLAALWGDPPWHDGARTGGNGMADLVTPLIGSQFSPSAPEWAGKEVKLRMWVTQNTDEDRLDLFSHPPLVRSPLD